MLILQTHPESDARRPETDRRDFVFRHLRAALSGETAAVPWDRFSRADWEELLRQAHPDVQGVGPLLYWRFKTGGWPESAPEPVRQGLQAQYYNTLAGNTLIYAELARILDAFRAAGIPVIVLKGAVLAVTQYENIGLRPMGDIDLLVRPDRLRAAMQALARCGYGLHKISVHAQYLLRPSEKVMVELHWGVLMTRADGSRQDQDWFWEHAVPAEEPALRGAHILAPSAHLEYLAAHAVHQHANHPGRLIWQVDMALLAEQAGCPAAATEQPRRAGERAAAHGEAPGDSGESEEVQGTPPVAHGALDDESPGRIAEALSLLDGGMRLRLFWRILVPPAGYIRARFRPQTGIQLPYFYLVRWIEGVRQLLAGRGRA